MGFLLSREIAMKYKPIIQRAGPKRQYLEGAKNLTDLFHGVDHRSVLLLRNIYEACVSGYLYHATGKEAEQYLY